MSHLTAKKFFAIFFFIFSFAALVTPIFVHAGEPHETKWGLGSVGAELGDNLPFANSTDPADKNISVLVGNVIKTLLSVLGLIFVLLIIYGGLRWMLARGDSGAIEEARNTMVHALIGLIIILSAYTITNFVIDQVSKIDEPPG